MKFLRLLLLPLAVVYCFTVTLRNYLYNAGIFASHSFALPVIAIGNLSTGGTGKTPLTEYLIRLLGSHYNVATLSRGYKRKSTGFVLAGPNSTADTLGDEPYQFYSKFKNVTVAVDANRKNGIKQLLQLDKKPQVIVLDDAYQHRRVKAGFYILLTAYGDLYTNDYILPAGNLREGKSGAARASVIIVTKCPPTLTLEQQNSIIQKLKPAKGQQVYFTSIAYDAFVYNSTTKIPVEDVMLRDKILVAGIAKPQPFFNHLGKPGDVLKAYPDHHDFTASEIEELAQLCAGKIIITTEKDYMRLKGKLPDDMLFYLPIKSSFLNNATLFDTAIIDFVKSKPL